MAAKGRVKAERGSTKRERASPRFIPILRPQRVALELYLVKH